MNKDKLILLLLNAFMLVGSVAGFVGATTGYPSMGIFGVCLAIALAACLPLSYICFGQDLKMFCRRLRGK